MRRFIAAATLVIVTGCSAFATKREAGYETAPLPGVSAESQASQDAYASARAEADRLWENRGDKVSLDQAIAAYEKALTVAPPEQHRELLERLARAYYFLAEGFYRAVPEQQKRLYNLATAYGERCMGLHPAFRDAIAAGRKPDDAVALLPKEYAGCIYWAAAGLGKWAALEGFATRIANKDKIKAWVSHVSQIEPTFFYGGPDRYWGSYYALLPRSLGGDLEKSKAHFEAALTIAPDYLATKVSMAERYAVAKEDRSLYQALLNDVIMADPNVLPDVAPENRVEQEKAKELLAQIDEKIPD